jgi:protein-S-isoprenylcysteine O-methyltransferase Ste14
MNTKIILIVAFSYLYVFFEIMMSRIGRRNRTIEKTSDKGSFWVLIVTIAIGYAISFGMGASHNGRMAPWNTFFAIGIILVLIGLYIRVKSILELKQQFTYNVTKIENHELIDKGWYGIIRHPGYLGQLIIFLGIATSMSNWLSILGMMLPVLAGFIYRINVEEIFMTEQLGQKYVEYKNRTKRLIPWIY